MNANITRSSTPARQRAWPWGRGLFMRLRALLATLRAEAELRALDARALSDLGIDAGGIGHAARHGRDRYWP